MELHSCWLVQHNGRYSGMEKWNYYFTKTGSIGHSDLIVVRYSATKNGRHISKSFPCKGNINKANHIWQIIAILMKSMSMLKLLRIHVLNLWLLKLHFDKVGAHSPICGGHSLSGLTLHGVLGHAPYCLLAVMRPGVTAQTPCCNSPLTFYPPQPSTSEGLRVSEVWRQATQLTVSSSTPCNRVWRQVSLPHPAFLLVSLSHQFHQTATRGDAETRCKFGVCTAVDLQGRCEGSSAAWRAVPPASHLLQAGFLLGRFATLKWRYVPPKRRCTYWLYDAISQKKASFITTTERCSNPTRIRDRPSCSVLPLFCWLPVTLFNDAGLF
jgi:hypothetical protein